MNQLSLETRVRIIHSLVEGNGIRPAARQAMVSKTTVIKLLVAVGKACQRFHNENVKNVSAKKVQCDEIWSYVYAKQKNVPKNKPDVGTVWTWVGLDADSKLVIGWLVGGRGSTPAKKFIWDIGSRLNLEERIQLTTDAHSPYVKAVNKAFASFIDFAQIEKEYGQPRLSNNKFSREHCTKVSKVTVSGNPDPKYISTNYVERQNLTIRMHMRRFGRRTNGASKNIEMHGYALALHFFYYNWVRIHKSIKTTPAIKAGLTDCIMTIEDIIKLAESK
jgi:IS1 family transposase